MQHQFVPSFIHWRSDTIWHPHCRHFEIYFAKYEKYSIVIKISVQCVPRGPLTISQHWFIWWAGDGQAMHQGWHSLSTYVRHSDSLITKQKANFLAFPFCIRIGVFKESRFLGNIALLQWQMLPDISVDLKQRGLNPLGFRLNEYVVKYLFFSFHHNSVEVFEI